MRANFIAAVIVSVVTPIVAFGSEDGGAVAMSGRPEAAVQERLMLLARGGYSCSPRRSCGQIGSCDEARWYLANCSWGGKLDRDSDGVPCETICTGG